MQRARTRARRRLVGALVLLAAGIVGFPLLFETQPRPLPVDTPIVTPAREVNLPPPAASAPRPVLPPDAGNEAPALAAASAASASAASAAPVAGAASSASAAVAGAAKTAAPDRAQAGSPPAPAQAASRSGAGPVAAAPAPAGRGADRAPEKAAAKGAERPPVAAHAPPAAASATGRFVVQVGAYNDAATLREARAKVERLGLKTYTQVIEADSGKRTRVRVGPFVSREEAQSVAGKLKGAGLPANILAL